MRSAVSSSNEFQLAMYHSLPDGIWSITEYHRKLYNVGLETILEITSVMLPLPWPIEIWLENRQYKRVNIIFRGNTIAKLPIIQGCALITYIQLCYSFMGIIRNTDEENAIITNFSHTDNNLSLHSPVADIEKNTG